MATKKQTKAKKKAPVSRRKNAPAKKKTGNRKGAAKISAKKSTKIKSSAKKVSSKKKASAKKKVLNKKKASIPKRPPAKKSAPQKTVKKKIAPAKKKGTTTKRAGTKPSPSSKAKRPVKKPAESLEIKSKADRNEATSEQRPKTRGRKNKHLSAKELRQFKQLLLNLRDSVVDEISFLAGDNLNSQQMERTGEEGTDNFNREFALKLVSSEQDIIYEIDEALRRLKNGTYGICEISGEPIEKERLKVLPHARHSVKVQSDLEKGRARYRPFGPTISRS